MVNLAAYSWTKYRIFNLKSRKNSCPQKVVILCLNFAGDFIRRWRIFFDFKTRFSKAPILLREMVHQLTKYSTFWFCCKKSTLRIKIQRWFFLWRCMNASPFRNIKNNRENLFWFLTYKLVFAKNRVFAHFRRRHVEAAANIYRRFRKPKLKDLWHWYLC